MTPYTLTRRSFLALVSSALLLGPLLHRAAQSPSDKRFVAQLIQVFDHESHAARVIGQAYLRQEQKAHDLTLLIRMLTEGDTTLLNCLERFDKARLETILRHRIRDDFSSGDVVELDGWVLSKTEARLCALHALI